MNKRRHRRMKIRTNDHQINKEDQEILKIKNQKTSPKNTRRKKLKKNLILKLDKYSKRNKKSKTRIPGSQRRKI